MSSFDLHGIRNKGIAESPGLPDNLNVGNELGLLGDTKA